MKNILFIESGVYGGGSFTSLLKHIRALDKLKYKAFVVFFTENDFSEELIRQGIKVFFVNDPVLSKKSKNIIYKFINKLLMKGMIRILTLMFFKFIHRSSTNRIKKIIEDNSIDLVHTNTEIFRDKPGIFAAKQMEIPLYSTLRSKYQSNKIIYNRNYVEFCNRYVDKFLYVSQDTRLFWENEVGLSSDKSNVINDYVLIPSQSPKGKKIPKKEIVFLCVANLIPIKNHTFLFNSLKNILIDTNSKLLLLGRGTEDYLQILENEVENLNIKNHVEFLGYKKNVNSFISKSDIVLLFSKSEGLPNIIIEAMSLGAVTIATKVGGISEIIDNEKNGFLIKCDELSDAINTIKKVIALDDDDIKKIQINAYRKIVEKYSLLAYSQIINRIYE